MLNKNKIAVIIPCYRVLSQLPSVLKKIPSYVDFIILVDDRCPDNSVEITLRKTGKKTKIHAIYHEKNMGVGGAVVSGYKKALELKADIFVKVDGDGQMDPSKIRELILPLTKNEADYAKGNRFRDFSALKSMPKVRLIGNSILSFLIKCASGYWNIMDPTNGFTAINKNAVQSLPLNKLAKRYYFETDMLINLNIKNKVIKDVPISAVYADEKSSLSIVHSILTFPVKIFFSMLKRIIFKYYVYDFNMASLYLLFGLPMLLFGALFGLYKWYFSLINNTATSTGTVMLAVLPLILGTQFILQAINIDMNNIPRKER